MSEADKPGTEAPTAVTQNPAGDPTTAVQEVKWWIDTGTKRQPDAGEPEPKGVIERWAFELLKDYRQEQALKNIVDINGQALRQLGNNEDRWVYLSLGVGEFPLKRLDYIKDSLKLPRYARALAIDAGYSIRVLLTGNPPGEKVLDINFTEAPSLDYWIDGELMEEQLFRSVDDALKRLRNSVHRYLRKSTAETQA